MAKNDGTDPAAGAVDPALTGLGLRLRTLRERAGLTLTQVSQEVGISVSTLSRLESDRRRATLELLLPLARLHRVSLDELIALPTLRDPRITPQVARSPGRVLARLTRRSSQMQIARTKVERGTAQSRPELASHQGFEWLYVLSGTVRLVLGDSEFWLTSGQAAEFDTTVPHWFSAAPGQRADYLTVLDGAGRAAHDRTVTT